MSVNFLFLIIDYIACRDKSVAFLLSKSWFDIISHIVSFQVNKSGLTNFITLSRDSREWFRFERFSLFFISTECLSVLSYLVFPPSKLSSRRSVFLKSFINTRPTLLSIPHRPAKLFRASLTSKKLGKYRTPNSYLFLGSWLLLSRLSGPCLIMA